MDNLRVPSQLYDHPRLKELRKRLGYEGYGIYLALQGFVAENGKEYRVTFEEGFEYSLASIARAVGITPQKLGKVLPVMAEVGLIDRKSLEEKTIDFKKYREFLEASGPKSEPVDQPVMLIKDALADRDGLRCFICKNEDDALCRHHIDYDPDNNDLSNLVLLCSSCHGKTNGNRNQWTYFFQKAIPKGFIPPPGPSVRSSPPGWRDYKAEEQARQRRIQAILNGEDLNPPGQPGTSAREEPFSPPGEKEDPPGEERASVVVNSTKNKPSSMVYSSTQIQQQQSGPPRTQIFSPVDKTLRLIAKNKFQLHKRVFATKNSKERLSSVLLRHGKDTVIEAWEYWLEKYLEWVVTYCQYPDAAFMASADSIIEEMMAGPQPAPSRPGSRPPDTVEFPDIRPLTDEQKKKIIEAAPNPFAAKKKEPPVDMVAAARAQLRALKEKGGEGTKE